MHALQMKKHYNWYVWIIERGRDGQHAKSLIWTQQKFLTGAVAALGENASI